MPPHLHQILALPRLLPQQPAPTARQRHRDKQNPAAKLKHRPHPLCKRPRRRLRRIIFLRRLLHLPKCNSAAFPCYHSSTTMASTSKDKLKILFLCTGNSCRSQMAEGFARALKSKQIEPYSAGIETHGLNQSAVKVMAEAGVDISKHQSKHVDTLKDIDF